MALAKIAEALGALGTVKQFISPFGTRYAEVIHEGKRLTVSCKKNYIMTAGDVMVVCGGTEDAVLKAIADIKAKTANLEVDAMSKAVGQKIVDAVKKATEGS
ncbi:Hypothetical protein POVN_LOCUS361 [uncultured virus]|nr:Hypothetical protein POVN_LOCUS361 [uncultured virus]